MLTRLVIKCSATVWRCTPKEISVRGGHMISRERREFAERHDRGEIDDELLLTLPNLSLLRYGTNRLEWAELPDDESASLDTLTWHEVDLSNENDWLDIPENVLVACVEAIFKANPHRSLEYDFLSAALRQVNQLMQTSLSELNTNDTPPAADSVPA